MDLQKIPLKALYKYKNSSLQNYNFLQEQKKKDVFISFQWYIKDKAKT